MSNFVRIAIAVVLTLHGLIHLMGTAVYLEWTTLEEFPYKTTVLGGAWDLGDGGIKVFGLLWAVGALGFFATALGFWLGWEGWKPALVGLAVFSLLLTGLDFGVAYAGVVINVLILAGVFWGPQLFG